MNNIGTVYFELKDYSKATEYKTLSLKLREEIKDKKGTAIALLGLGTIHEAQNNHSKALPLLNRSMELSKELGFPENIKNVALALSKHYKATNDPKKALENYELFILMRDSLSNEQNRKASIRSQLKYEYEKQAAADSVAHAKDSEIKNAELAKQKAEIKAKKNQQYALFGGLGLVCLFGVFMFNRYKITQKQKEIIEGQKEIVEKQKKLVEEKQKEILDSIHYAKRIQLAQIPSEKQVVKMILKLKR